MSRFEDRLFSELVEQHGALLADAPAPALTVLSPAPRRWTARRFLPAGAIALALALAIVALVTGFGSGPTGTPAYAVLSNPDGTVTVTVRELTGVSGADSALQTLGVHARVVRSESACQLQPAAYRTAKLTPEQSQAIASGATSAGEASVVIAPAAIPSGDSVVIGVRSLGSDGGPPAVGLQIAIYEGPTPPCLPAAG